MATIYDGIRVFNPAIGGSILAADHQAFQDKMILGMEERERSLSMPSAMQADAGGWSIRWTIGATPSISWVSAGGCDLELLFPTDLRENEHITEAHIWLKGAVGNPTGGSVALYKAPLNGAGAADALTTFGCAGNFWDTDGVITHLSAVGLAIDVDATCSFFVGILGPTGACVVVTVYGVQLVTQFHKG